MSSANRVRAINSVAAREVPVMMEPKPVSIEDYGCDVFNKAAMKKYLPNKVAQKLFATINEGAPLDPEVAVDVAHGMKQWALERGATHYTHWFQPLTGTTAEKHDSFVDPVKDGGAILAFSGKNLIVGEPDASSFPSGGLRSTFEARGYTAWDPTSPAFIKRHSNGATLCIPTAFCSYTGEALDKKTPLLRSVQALKKSVARLMACFGKTGSFGEVTLGPEQEYFLIDKNFYLQRPDLHQTGRTLFGAPPAKHQQLEDHYFGSIKSRIISFMTEVEHELWRLGIPAKTRHNEVAPAQFEIAPVFEDVNLAIDHNMVVMEVLRQVAEKNGLVCLLHEKPFAGVNGSGKHNNWSLSYGDTNLLNPGHDPHQNAIFMTTLCCIIKAVDRHSDLLRSATAGAGNDHRLGANEAPPAIISMFLGEQLSDVIDQIEAGNVRSSKKAGAMRIGVDTLPPLPRDATDRNRTSPFAFTGNKFEFRAPGSSQSCAGANVVINTIVSEAFDEMSEALEKLKPEEFNIGLQLLLQKIIREHKRIIFNGDNYSKEWAKEAGRRGLPNLRTTMDALKALVMPENVALFEKYGVFSKVELESRYEVFLEEYHRKIRIEGEIAYEIAKSIIIPVASDEYSKYAVALSEAENGKIKGGMSSLREMAESIGEGLDELTAKTNKLKLALAGCHEEIISSMLELRKAVDSLEKIVSDERWPLPKYREMLFIY